MIDLYYWQFAYIETVRKLYIRKKLLEKKMESYPKGNLARVVRSSGRKEWYWNKYTDGVLAKKYLSEVKDKTVIETLTKKQYELPVLKKEYRQISSVCRILFPTTRQIVSEIEVRNTIYPPSFSENPLHPEWLKYKTNRGEVVRSISERIIADTLYKYGLNYKYEKTLNLNGVDIHPDFTIINPFSGIAYYWEHLGLNTEEYIKSWHKKLAIYAENKINIGDNLIISTQEDINSIENMVREWFTMERYKMFID